MGVAISKYNRDLIIQEKRFVIATNDSTTSGTGVATSVNGSITPISINSVIEASVFMPNPDAARVAGTIAERYGILYIKNVTDAVDSPLTLFGRQLVSASAVGAGSNASCYLKHIFNAGTLSARQFVLYFSSLSAGNVEVRTGGNVTMILRELSNA